VRQGCPEGELKWYTTVGGVQSESFQPQCGICGMNTHRPPGAGWPRLRWAVEDGNEPCAAVVAELVCLRAGRPSIGACEGVAGHQSHGERERKLRPQDTGIAMSHFWFPPNSASWLRPNGPHLSCSRAPARRRGRFQLKIRPAAPTGDRSAWLPAPNAC
jgi:hypothetical protein